MSAAAERGAARILVIDDDYDVGEVVTAILSDEGYEVTTLDHISDEAVRAAIGRLEPDCILLDGAEATEYTEAWATAADVRHRTRRRRTSEAALERRGTVTQPRRGGERPDSPDSQPRG